MADLLTVAIALTLAVWLLADGLHRWARHRTELEQADSDARTAAAWSAALSAPLPPGVTLERALELADRRGITLEQAAYLLHRDLVTIRTVALVRRRRYAARFAIDHPNLPTEESNP